MNITLDPADFLTGEFEQALQQSLEKALPAVMAKLGMSKPNKLLLTADEAAELLSMSRRALDALTAKGEVPVVRLTSRPQYDPRDLQVYVDSRKQPARESGSERA